MWLHYKIIENNQKLWFGQLRSFSRRVFGLNVNKHLCRTHLQCVALSVVQKVDTCIKYNYICPHESFQYLECSICTSSDICKNESRTFSKWRILIYFPVAKVKTSHVVCTGSTQVKLSRVRNRSRKNSLTSGISTWALYANKNNYWSEGSKGKALPTIFLWLDVKYKNFARKYGHW